MIMKLMFWRTELAYEISIDRSIIVIISGSVVSVHQCTLQTTFAPERFPRAIRFQLCTQQEIGGRTYSNEQTFSPDYCLDFGELAGTLSTSALIGQTEMASTLSVEWMYRRVSIFSHIYDETAHKQDGIGRKTSGYSQFLRQCPFFLACFTFPRFSSCDNFSAGWQFLLNAVESRQTRLYLINIKFHYSRITFHTRSVSHLPRECRVRF